MFTAQTKTLYLTKRYLYISVYVTVCTKQNLGSIRNMFTQQFNFQINAALSIHQRILKKRVFFYQNQS